MQRSRRTTISSMVSQSRFFDRTAIDALFAEGWNERHAEEHIVHRYAFPKALWEVVFEKSA